MEWIAGWFLLSLIVGPCTGRFIATQNEDGEVMGTIAAAVKEATRFDSGDYWTNYLPRRIQGAHCYNRVAHNTAFGDALMMRSAEAHPEHRRRWQLFGGWK